MKKIKDTITGIIVLAVVIALTWGSYQIGNRKYESLCDSISALTPDTLIIHDTIPPVDSINWIDSTRLSFQTVYDTVIHDSIRYYNDSIINDELAIYFREKVDGLILSRDVGYRLKVPKIIKETTTIKIPYPVIQPVARKTELYYGFGMGFGQEGFVMSGNIDVLTKKNIMYGAGILRTESRGYLMLNVKFKL